MSKSRGGRWWAEGSGTIVRRGYGLDPEGLTRYRTNMKNKDTGGHCGLTLELMLPIMTRMRKTREIV
jgi:hypothetical protein